MENKFNSYFKNQLNDFYEYKVSCGYSYKSELYKLIVFDKYLCKNNVTELNKEYQITFLNSLNIKNSSKLEYSSVLREFSKYLLSKYNINVYILPRKLYTRKGENYIPYIFSEQEIKLFFNTIDNIDVQNELKKDMMTVIFKLLYCTGMRIGECLNIKIYDIDFDNNAIVLRNTKNGTDRRIIINEELKNVLKELHDKYNKEKSINEYFFRNNNDNKYNNNSIYNYFRKILYYSKIQHSEKGPRIHDFRHTFCVKSLKKIIEEEKDINVYIPVLSAYVGHKNFKGTEYYLRLTAEMYPYIRNQIEEYTNNIIRKLGDFDE